VNRRQRNLARRRRLTVSIYPPALDQEFGPRVQPPPPEPVERGFPGLRCILCGEKDCVKLRLLDCTFLCDQCEEEFDAEDVRAHLQGWDAVVRWVNSAPAAANP
jgi:hypothetical protein